MKEDISIKLYNKFYQNNEVGTNSLQASTHWKIFSQHFKIEKNTDGTIKYLKGYGFGGNDDKRILASLMASIENTLQQVNLSYKGLSSAKREAKKMVESMGLSFSRDAFRQVCTKYFLDKEISKTQIEVKNILIIGDGHGVLAALMSEQYPQARIFLIDLGVTLFFQAYYLQKKFPDKAHILLEKVNQTIIGKGFFYCPAEELEYFPQIELDLAINIASMQEMDLPVVNNYFELMRDRKTKLLYCCNRLEKTLPDGSITRFFDYPWKKEDKNLVDEKCPWHQFFFARSSAPNLQLFNLIPIPLLHRYDGIHWHRFTQLSQ